MTHKALAPYNKFQITYCTINLYKLFQSHNQIIKCFIIKQLTLDCATDIGYSPLAIRTTYGMQLNMVAHVAKLFNLINNDITKYVTPIEQFPE